jgi:hypothetical protein
MGLAAGILIHNHHVCGHQFSRVLGQNETRWWMKSIEIGCKPGRMENVEEWKCCSLLIMSKNDHDSSFQFSGFRKKIEWVTATVKLLELELSSMDMVLEEKDLSSKV